MISGVPLETCWAFNKLWNNKFCYKLHLVGISIESYCDARIYEYQNCKLRMKKSSKSQPEDSFRKKAETCSCHYVLMIFSTYIICNRVCVRQSSYIQSLSTENTTEMPYRKKKCTYLMTYLATTLISAATCA